MINVAFVTIIIITFALTVKFLTSISLGSAGPYIYTAIGTFIAIALAFRAERKGAQANNKAANAEAVAQADKARTEYVNMVEREVILLRDRVDDCDKRTAVIQLKVTALEVSENLCQQERVKLQTDNSNLRRRIEDLEWRLNDLTKK